MRYDTMKFWKKKEFKTFTKFPDLPPEVRVKIWEFALGGPQTIKVDFDFRPRCTIKNADRHDNTPAQDRKGIRWRISQNKPAPETETTVSYYCVASNSLPLQLFRVCQESRAEASRRMPNFIAMHWRGKKIYFHPEIDTLFFDVTSSFYLEMLHNDRRGNEQLIHSLESVKHIALERFTISPHGFHILSKCYFGKLLTITPLVNERRKDKEPQTQDDFMSELWHRLYHNQMYKADIDKDTRRFWFGDRRFYFIHQPFRPGTRVDRRGTPEPNIIRETRDMLRRAARSSVNHNSWSEDPYTILEPEYKNKKFFRCRVCQRWPRSCGPIG